MTALLDPIDYQAPDAAQRFVDSLRHTGFAVLGQHPIPAQQVTAIYRSWQAFFDSPSKHDYRYDPEHMDGFFRPRFRKPPKATASGI
ncbi:MAG: hypothetical protein R3E95_18270 [Thiolinea sp.]